MQNNPPDPFFTLFLTQNRRYVDHIPRAVKGTVDAILTSKEDLNNRARMMDILQLEVVRDREIQHLSGGELQRFAIGVVCVQRADV
jgi:ATP-binding cassette subfamily E protein 1